MISWRALADYVRPAADSYQISNPRSSPMTDVEQGML